MNKNKYFVIGGASLAVLLLVGGGVFAWSATHKDEPTYGNASQASSDGALIGVKNNRTAGGLGQLQPPEGASEPGSPTANPPAAGASSNASSSSSSSSTTTSPSNFKQYDKYKNYSESLSGEIKAGTGASAAVGKKVSINYKVWLTNGKQVEESKPGVPLDFIIGSSSVVNGLSTGVVNMQVGGSRLVVIPPAVGYKDEQHGSIPPNSVLVYQVELVNVQ